MSEGSCGGGGGATRSVAGVLQNMRKTAKKSSRKTSRPPLASPVRVRGTRGIHFSPKTPSGSKSPTSSTGGTPRAKELASRVRALETEIGLLQRSALTAIVRDARACRAANGLLSVLHGVGRRVCGGGGGDPVDLVFGGIGGQIAAIFDLADEDGDGVLSARELSGLLSRLGGEGEVGDEAIARYCTKNGIPLCRARALRRRGSSSQAVRRGRRGSVGVGSKGASLVAAASFVRGFPGSDAVDALGSGVVPIVQKRSSSSSINPGGSVGIDVGGLCMLYAISATASTRSNPSSPSTTPTRALSTRFEEEEEEGSEVKRSTSPPSSTSISPSLSSSPLGLGAVLSAMRGDVGGVCSGEVGVVEMGRMVRGDFERLFGKAEGGGGVKVVGAAEVVEACVPWMEVLGAVAADTSRAKDRFGEEGEEVKRIASTSEVRGEGAYREENRVLRARVIELERLTRASVDRSEMLRKEIVDREAQLRVAHITISQLRKVANIPTTAPTSPIKHKTTRRKTTTRSPPAFMAIEKEYGH